MNTKFRVLLVLLIVGFAGVGMSAVQTQGTLPAEAEAALARGAAAVRGEQWDIAVRYFTEAQSHAPDSSGIMYNLGLAVDRAGGRELVALAWYGAYLAAAPEALNAEQVRSRMFDLEIQIEVNADRLLSTARQIAAEVINPELSAGLLAEVVRAESGEEIPLTPSQEVDFYWDIEPASVELSGPQGPAVFLVSFAKQQSARRLIRSSVPGPIDAAAPFDTFVDRLRSLEPDEMVGTAVCGAMHLMDGLTTTVLQTAYFMLASGHERQIEGARHSGKTFCGLFAKGNRRMWKQGAYPSFMRPDPWRCKSYCKRRTFRRYIAFL